MTGVSSQRSSKFCDEGADGGEEEVGALLPEGNRTTGPFLTPPSAAPGSFPTFFPSLFFPPVYFHFIQLNFSDVVLHHFSLLCTEIISVMPWVCGLIRKHKYYKKTPEFILENFLDHKLLVCWKLLYIKGHISLYCGISSFFCTRVSDFQRGFPVLLARHLCPL